MDWHYKMKLEASYIEESKVNDKELNEVVLNRLKDSDVKEMLIKKIEAHAHAYKIAVAKKITKKFTGE